MNPSSFSFHLTSTHPSFLFSLHLNNLIQYSGRRDIDFCEFQASLASQCYIVRPCPKISKRFNLPNQFSPLSTLQELQLVLREYDAVVFIILQNSMELFKLICKLSISPQNTLFLHFLELNLQYGFCRYGLGVIIDQHSISFLEPNLRMSEIGSTLQSEHQ